MHAFKTISRIFLLGILALPMPLLAQSDAVKFSGMVKKVLIAKNKVAIKDPETKKRFTVIINSQSQLEGFSDIEGIKKGDSVTGKYIVTPDGKYIATEFRKK